MSYKIKGKTLQELVKTKEGIGLLRWVKDQPVQEGKWKDYSLKRNEEIGKILANLPVEEPEKSPPDNLVISRLDILETNTKNIMSKLDKILTEIETLARWYGEEEK